MVRRVHVTRRGSGALSPVYTRRASREPGARAATPEQCNDLARLVCTSVEIEDDRVAAVVPRADFAPFFVLTEHSETGRPAGLAPEGQEVSLSTSTELL